MAETLKWRGSKLPEADAAFNLLEFGFGTEAVPGGIGLQPDQIGVVYAEVLFQSRQRRFLLAQVHIGLRDIFEAEIMLAISAFRIGNKSQKFPRSARCVGRPYL